MGHVGGKEILLPLSGVSMGGSTRISAEVCVQMQFRLYKYVYQYLILQVYTFLYVCSIDILHVRIRRSYCVD